MKRLYEILFYGSLLFLISCTKGTINPYYKTITIDAVYSNIDSPLLTVDTVRYSWLFPFGFHPRVVDSSNNSVYITLTNVRFEDALGIYEVGQNNNITVLESTNDQGYQADVEDSLIVSKIAELDYVLVLDYSASLGDNIKDVKENAISTINTIAGNYANAKVGVVIFATDIVEFGLTKDYASAINFIDTCKINRNYTSLFEAIDLGVKMLDTSSADGLALIAFTDGINNNWGNYPTYQTDNSVINNIKKATRISTYTIGYTANGGVDQVALNALALNGGFSVFANDYMTLNRVFSKVTQSLSAVYTLTYKRNNSKINNQKLRFQIKTKLL